MAISLCSALVLVTLSQAPPLPVAPTDSLATLRGRAAQDSSDAQLWLLMGRAYLGLGVEAHGATHRSSEDSVWTRAVLDTAEEALGRAAALAGPLGSSAVGDSARVFRVGAWAARSWLGWEVGGVKAGVEAWGPLPMDLRVPPVLDELGTAPESRRVTSCSARCAWRSTAATHGPSPRSRPTPGPRAPLPRCAMRWRRSRWPPTCRRAGNNVTYHQARTGREPRRDRVAHHPRLPRGGPRGGGGLFGSRSAVAPCARSRCGRAARVSDGSRVLSRHREARGGGAELGVPGGTPRVRVPVGARAVCGSGSGGVARVHRAPGGGHPGQGRHNGGAAPHAASGRSHCAWLYATARRPCAGSTGGGPARVSGTPQGGRGRRRQGHAVGPRVSRARGGIRSGVE